MQWFLDAANEVSPVQKIIASGLAVFHQLDGHDL
jgi:hypothetical protein